MQDSRIPMSPTKGAGTGIPRFSSKLPAPKTTASTNLPPPTEKASALRSPSKLAFRSSINQETPSKPATTGIPASSKRSSIVGPGFIAPRPPSAQAVNRSASPFKSSVIQRPGSRLAQTRPRPLSIVRSAQPEHEDVNDQLGSLDSFRTASRIGHREQSPDPEPEVSSPFIEDATPKPRKASRPSLSDRTVESLSQLPATPATDRRRSGFFNGESPMVSPVGPPSRPASAMSVPKRSEGGFAKPTPRLASPVKRPVTTIAQPSKRMSIDHSKPTPGRRAVSASVPRPSLSATITPSFSASVRGGKPPVPSQTTSRASIRPPPSASKVPPPSASKLTTTTRLTKAGTKPLPRPITTSARPATTRPASSASTRTATSNRAIPQTDGSPDTPMASPAKSSATLREQIAKAKAAKRAATVQNDSGTRTSTGEFDLDTDPFNQRPKDNKGVLRKRIEAARADGRLNIAAMGLTEVPDEVLRMYDADQVANSNISWNESVDLTRFMAADNQFETLADDVFPDVDPATAAEEEDPRGYQFAGLEMLDLHGNRLQSLPLGLRRLERLTTLNLSHNQFGNAAFEKITQITSLKELRLGHNNISGYLPQSISKLVDLEVLDIQHNKLLNLPEDCLRGLTHLRILNVSSNQLTGMPMDVLEALPLTDLDASRNSLVGALFSFSAAGMPKLRELNVSNNSLASLAFSANLSLPSLRMLSVTNNRIVSLPDVSGWLELATLAAGDNKITEIPPGFTSLRLLKHADFSSNDMTRLDERIAGMDCLESLLVDANPLQNRKYLSMSTDAIKRDLRTKMGTPEVDQRHSVQSFEDEAIDVRSPEDHPSPWKLASGNLDLSGKNLTDDDGDMLRSFLGVNNVKEMQLARNNFTMIPFELSLAQSLRVLDISSCQLDDNFLQEPMALPSLIDLQIYDNKISTLDPLLRFLHAPGLQHLDVSHNRLSGKVPLLRSAFPNLADFHAADNKFETLPAEAVKGMHSVILSRNNVMQLQPEIGLLWFEGLRGLDVSGNAFRVPNYRVLEKGTEATLAWLRDRIPGYVGDDETF